MSGDLDLVPFEVKHLAAIPRAEPVVSPEPNGAAAVAAASHAYTLLEDGRPVACGGLLRVDETRAIAWAWIGHPGPRALLRTFRAMKAGLEHMRYPQVDAIVVDDWLPGQRWLRLLGFSLRGQTEHGLLFVRTL